MPGIGDNDAIDIGRIQVKDILEAQLRIGCVRPGSNNLDTENLTRLSRMIKDLPDDRVARDVQSVADTQVFIFRLSSAGS